MSFGVFDTRYLVKQISRLDFLICLLMLAVTIDLSISVIGVPSYDFLMDLFAFLLACLPRSIPILSFFRSEFSSND